MNGGGFIGEGRDVCVVFMFFAVFLLAPCLKVAVTILEVWEGYPIKRVAA